MVRVPGLSGLGRLYLMEHAHKELARQAPALRNPNGQPGWKVRHSRRRKNIRRGLHRVTLSLSSSNHDDAVCLLQLSELACYRG